MSASTSASSARRVALVTGASRGIGAEIARRLARDGFHVVVHYAHGAAEAREVCASIERAGGSATLLQADLSTSDGPQNLADGFAEPHLDVLVNNAGIAPFEAIEDMSEGSYDRLSNVNMRSMFFVTKYLLPKLRDGGRIVNLSSIVARTAFPGIPAYSATKGFVDVFTLQLAASLGARNITVNASPPA